MDANMAYVKVLTKELKCCHRHTKQFGKKHSLD